MFVEFADESECAEAAVGIREARLNPARGVSCDAEKCTARFPDAFERDAAA